MDGEPVDGAEVTVVEGNDRFRDEVGEVVVTTDAEGNFEVEWTSAGRFWLNTSVRLEGQEFQGIPLNRGASYTLTFEVLPD